jgi:pyruvate/2-oxoacid:ferredoxin oxidoreductase beta subunit
MSSTKLVNVARCKPNGYEATVGAFSRTAATRELAVTLAVVAARDQLAHTYDRAYFACKDGTLLVVYFADGWMYDIVRNGLVSCCTRLNSASFEDAKEQARAFVDGYDT